MHLAARGHDVLAVDNYLRRTVALQTDSEALIPSPNLETRADIFRDITGHEVATRIGDITEWAFISEVVRDFRPDALIHYAEQPSAPYSMRGYPEARLTLENNLNGTMNVAWAVMQYAPDCHIVKLGTMGEYGTPNIDIEEGWIDIEHKGRSGRFLFPRQAGSLYHTTKILDTDLLWFYVRMGGLAVTDLMQGPVYGLETAESALDPRLVPNFHYDDIFGTVVNRFLVQAAAGIPLTVYGKGGQVRGYLNLNDTLQCIQLALDTPASPGDLRIFNQFTETLSVNEIAARVQEAGDDLGLEVKVESIENPRIEPEEHYYNPVLSGLKDLGLEPHYMTKEVLTGMLQLVLEHREAIDPGRVMPRVTWK